jgi:hypothetical protein
VSRRAAAVLRADWHRRACRADPAAAASGPRAWRASTAERQP